jgi:hypothetical protein
MPDDPTALRDALAGLQEIFARAAAARLRAIRDLAGADVGVADAPALRALVEALLRREAADADQQAPLAERVEAAATQAAAAQQARAALAAHPAVLAQADAVAATWTDALERSDVLAARLDGRVAPAIAQAFAAYVGALRALHGAGPQTTPEARAAAAAAYADAEAALERAI